MLVTSLAATAVLLAVAVSPVGAYGGGADHDMWQVGLSFNCNNPGFCGSPQGGFWGWVEFDRSADGTQTWGNAELTGCAHTVGGGGFAGAFHLSIDVTSWTIGAGSAGPQTFFASGVGTESFRGEKVTAPFSNMDTGIPAAPGHYSTSEILGFAPPPGVAFQIQVAFRPAK
jgi:hypothetical protein